MSNIDELIKTLSKSIIDAVEEKIKKAKFDKTSIGIVKEVAGNNYTVNAFGGTYVIKSSEKFKVNQHVAVTAPQSNFNNLIMRAI